MAKALYIATANPDATSEDELHFVKGILQLLRVPAFDTVEALEAGMRPGTHGRAYRIETELVGDVYGPEVAQDLEI